VQSLGRLRRAGVTVSGYAAGGGWTDAELAALLSSPSKLVLPSLQVRVALQCTAAAREPGAFSLLSARLLQVRPQAPAAFALCVCARGGDHCVLQVGIVYVFRVTVSSTSGPAVSSSASVTVVVVPAGVRAALSGGDREVGTSSSWTLDGSGSEDVDRVASEPLRYSWRCSIPGDALCFSASGTRLDSTALAVLSHGGQPNTVGPLLTVPADTLAVGQYTFTLTVAKGASGGLIPNHYREASASTTVTVVPGSPPTVIMAQSEVKVRFVPGGGGSVSAR
jgi:hypothetical protein